MDPFINIGQDIVIGKGFKAKHWTGPIIFGKDAIYLLPSGLYARGDKTLAAGYGVPSMRSSELGYIIAAAIGVAYSQIGKAGWFWGFAVLVVLGPILNAIINKIGAKSSPNKASDSDSPRWQEHVITLSNLPPEITSNPEWPIKKGTRPVIVISRGDVDRIEHSSGKIIVDAYGVTMKLGIKLFGRSSIVNNIRQFGWNL